MAKGPPAVGFAGMTHLGLVSAAAAAAKGVRVVCFDADAQRIEALRAGRLPVLEPQLPELLARHADAIRFGAEASDLAACELVYVAPDVPTDDRGLSDLAEIETLLQSAFAATRAETPIVILSQVPPGFTRARQRPNRSLHYQVETLIFGRAVERALAPERFIVGCADPILPLPSAYARYLGRFGCPVLPMRYESAELAKIAINCCLVASISAANTLAELCEKIGADWREIVPALKLDKRIGAHAYLAPGLGIAGGNLERDLATVCRLADESGSDASVVRAFIAHSAHRKEWAWRTLQETVLATADDPLFAVLGLAYKENTRSTKNSPALALIAHLTPYRVRLYDPAVPASAAAHPRAAAASSPLEACTGADALVIMTPWPEFRALDPAAVAAALRGSTVIDPYGVLDSEACRRAGLDHRTLGVPARAKRPDGARA